ncbi:MAG: chloride channel protein [Pseudomonadota bacterium]
MQLIKKIGLHYGFFSALAGVLAGLASSLFLFLLNYVTQVRTEHAGIIWGLPLAGFVIGWIYQRYGGRNERGTALVIDEIIDPRERIAIVMAPLIFFSTLLTHLFGGSAGREGTAVQMGASLSDQVARKYHVTSQERKALLLAGAGAGFGSAVGAPWAGVVFGLEMSRRGPFQITAFWQCLIASWTAWGVTQFLELPHTVYPAPHFFAFSVKGFSSVGLASLLFGLLAWGFSKSVHQVQNLFMRKVSFSPLRPFIGGMILVGMYAWEGSYRYAGLGIPIIQESLYQPAELRDLFFKFVFTVLTLGSGFKGGEFIPLVFMGTVLGSSLSSWLPLSSNLLGAIGFAAVFGAASNTPLACTLMAIELFGYPIAPYALVGCFISHLLKSRLK